MNLDAKRRAELRDRIEKLSHVDWAVVNLQYALDDLDDWERAREGLRVAFQALEEDEVSS